MGSYLENMGRALLVLSFFFIISFPYCFPEIHRKVKHLFYTVVKKLCCCKTQNMESPENPASLEDGTNYRKINLKHWAQSNKAHYMNMPQNFKIAKVTQEVKIQSE